jgi:flagellar motor switch protein FliN/FliY
MPGELNPSQEELDRLFGGEATDDGPVPPPVAVGAHAAGVAFDQGAGPGFGSAPELYGPAGEQGLPELAAAPSVNAAQFAALAPQDANGHDAAIDLLLDVSLQISVELGRTRMTIGEILTLKSGAVIELDKLAGEPADILVNGTLIARGEVVVVDEKFGVRVLEVVSRARRLASLA